MSAGLKVPDLLGPIAPDAPCGRNLEEAGDLAALDAFQIFGQDSLDPVIPKKGDPVPKEVRKSKSDRPPNWVEVGELSIGMLGKSKDLRVLAHLGAAALWLDGPRLATFVSTLSAAAKWLTEYWAQVYPLIDEDAIFRRNALNCFGDRSAVVEGLRRAPLVEHRQHGRFSLRDLQNALSPPPVIEGVEAAPVPDEARISAAFSETPFAELKGLQASAVEGLAALTAIEEAARTAAGTDATPNFEGIASLLHQLDAVLRARIALHPDAVAAGEAGAEGGAVGVGAIRSRQDAIRALEAAGEFFRRNEPSSPVPLIIDRAKRLIQAKDFLEVIADVAPEALASARAVGGIRD